MAPILDLYLIAIVGAIIIGAWILYPTRHRSTKSIPGPKGLPLLGSTIDVARCPTMIPLFKTWAAKYGPVVQFGLLGQTHVVLSSEKIIHDLFAKRGELYSDRGMANAVRYFTNDLNPGIIDKNDLWRKQRKLMHSVISSTENVKYDPAIEAESIYTLSDLADSPEFFDEHLARFAHGLITRLGFGTLTKSMSDPYIKEVHRMNEFAVGCFRPDKYLSNVLPWLLKAPSWICSDSKILLEERHKMEKLIHAEQESVRSRMRTGTAPECVQKHFLEHQQDYGLTDLEGGAVFQAFMGAGTRSPHNFLLGFTINMLQHPEWLAKVQQQIDEVVGSSRLPDVADLPNLPIVRAVVKEAIRYRTIYADLIIPHKLSQDDVYDGYFFSAGTIFHANFCTILSDPETYPDGLNFRPDRWIDPKFPTYKEPLTTYPNLVGFQSFGIGRRACPGASFTERSLTIMVARIVSSFNITKAKDPLTGEPIDPKLEFEPVVNPRPLPFPAAFEVRSPERRQLLANEMIRIKRLDSLMPEGIEVPV